MGRVVLVVLSLALLATAAGCGAKKTVSPVPKHRGSPDDFAYVRAAPAHGSWVHVSVVDGDQDHPVRGAFVRIGKHARVSDRHGVAKIHLKRRSALVVHVRARGYSPAAVRYQFRNHPLHTVRVYQPKLQWPMYGAGPTRTHVQPNIKLRPPFRIAWSRGMAGLLEFPAVVSDGVAFVGNAWGSVRAVSMGDGALVWRHDIRHGKLASSPAIWGDEIVVHGMEGAVTVLDRYSGKVAWRRWIGSPIESSPVTSNGIDYFGAWNGSVYALDLKTHRFRWVYRSGAKITSSAARVGNTVYIGNYGGRLLALNARTGRLRFAVHVNGRIYGTPAVTTSRIFVPSSDGDSLTAFSRTGARRWSLHTGSYVYSSPAVWAGRVYFGSYNGFLYCASASSGRILWRYSSGRAISGSPVIVDGVVYFSNFYHRIYGLSARTGRKVFHFPDGDFVPVSGNGRLLLLHGYSRIYAVKPKRR
jgi:outer membrane protein assembly factor BamB